MSPNPHTGRKTNLILIQFNTILKQLISYHLIGADIISCFVASKGKKKQN